MNEQFLYQVSEMFSGSDSGPGDWTNCSRLEDKLTAQHSMVKAAQRYVRLMADMGYVCEYMRIPGNNSCYRMLKVRNNITGVFIGYKHYRIRMCLMPDVAANDSVY
jgi:hypothetical protein